jgi:hypothetical protein
MHISVCSSQSTVGSPYPDKGKYFLLLEYGLPTVDCELQTVHNKPILDFGQVGLVFLRLNS